MYAILTIARYPRWLAWGGFLSMAFFRLPLVLNRKISFYKLLGCGKNGTFDKVPDLQQWGVLAISNDIIGDEKMYGSFIRNWWRLFRCSTWTLVLQPLEGYGTWDGKEVFGVLPRTTAYDGLIAVLTRATIRPGSLQHFWQHVDGVARHMSSAKGFITSLGIGEVPWIKQATFSIWENKESMKRFAYKMQEHADVIRKTRQENWYSEDMFVRFKILSSTGSLYGKNPLQGKV